MQSRTLNMHLSSKTLCLPLLVIIFFNHALLSKGSRHMLQGGKYYRNEVPITTITVDDGDIYDCMKLDSHLRKRNPSILRKIQSREKPSLHGTITTANNSDHVSTRNRRRKARAYKKLSCPPGSFPVLKATKAGPLNFSAIERFASSRARSFLKSKTTKPLADDPQLHEYAVASIKGRYGGAEGILSIWQPTLEDDGEISLSQIWVLSETGDDLSMSLEAGWMSHTFTWGRFDSSSRSRLRPQKTIQTLYDHDCHGFSAVNLCECRLLPLMITERAVDGLRMRLGILPLRRSSHLREAASIPCPPMSHSHNHPIATSADASRISNRVRPTELVNRGQQAHSWIIISCLQQIPFLVTSLINMYSKCHQPWEAVKVFRHTIEPNVFAWNALIAGLIHGHYFSDAVGFYHEIDASLVRGVKFTYPCVLKACTNLQYPWEGRKVLLAWNDGYNTWLYNDDCKKPPDNRLQFTRTDNYMPFGKQLHCSTIDGDDTELEIMIIKDVDQDWEVWVDETMIGFWPKSNYRARSANVIDWGGEILNKRTMGRHTSTQMGNGHFSSEPIGRVAYIRNMALYDLDLDRYNAPDAINMKVTQPDCYDLKYYPSDDEYGQHITFGGPGYERRKCP
ncbi:Pentatricopeptide repeat-containing protein [Nymphaea thermarum]|nr:Pentatricopeptide repeat-containing protein [Nymphaea thermarum]